MASERILLVDNEVNARSALRSLLGDEGYQVREAKDGDEGLRQLADFAPAVVLCDVRMPGMDGLQLLKKAKEQGSDAIFLMMTAYANVESAVEAMRAGAENYLVKPLAVDALLLFLQKALEKRRLERDAASLRERFLAVLRLAHVVPLVAEEGSQSAARVLFVIDQQNPFRGHRRIPPPRNRLQHVGLR